MPTASDPNLSAAGLPLSHNPLQRINFTPPKLDINIDDIINQLVKWVQDFLFPAIKQLTGIDLAPFLPAVQSVITNLETIFGSLNPTSGEFNPGAALQAFVNLLVELGISIPITLAQEFVGFIAGQPILKQLFGMIAGGKAPTPVGSLTATQPNLLPTPIFSPDTIADNPDWIPDTTSERTTGNGSVEVVADGTEKALRSGIDPSDVIAVGAGQTITATIYVENQGYFGPTGVAAYELQLAPFDGTTLGDFITIASYTPIQDVAWPGEELTGSWPVADGVTGVQLRIHDTGNGQAGVFHFADGTLTSATDTNIVPGLTQVISSVNQVTHALMDGIASAAKGIPVVGAEAADVIEAIENFNPANVLGTLGSEVLQGDLSGIVNTLFGAITKQPAASTNATLADLYNAMAQLAHNTDGSDVTQFADTTTVIPVDPTWANYLHVVLVGEGQDGQGGFIAPGFYGQGGQPGKTAMTLWAKGTHYDNTLTGVSITVNANGSITASIPGHSFTAAKGGAPQATHLNALWQGIGIPQGIDFNGAHFATGGNQNTPGAAGLGPGGGGAGARGFGIFSEAGGPGGPAGAWVRACANAVPGQVNGSDTTGPTGGTVVVEAISYDSLTLTPSGAVDA